MSTSIPSPEVNVSIPEAPPGPPMITSVSVSGRRIVLSVVLPLVNEDGVTLATPLSKVHVHYKQTSFALPDAEGTVIPDVVVDATAPATEVAIDGLERGKTYYFVACVE